MHALFAEGLHFSAFSLKAVAMAVDVFKTPFTLMHY
jgi:hypothetical protein